MIRTCIHCTHKAQCYLREQHRETIRAMKPRGLSVRTIDIECDRRLSELPPGQPVKCRLLEYGDPEYGGHEFSVFTGWVLGPSRRDINKVAVWLTDPPERRARGEERKTPIVHVFPDRLIAIAGDRLEICGEDHPVGVNLDRWKWSCSVHNPDRETHRRGPDGKPLCGTSEEDPQFETGIFFPSCDRCRDLWDVTADLPL